MNTISANQEIKTNYDTNIYDCDEIEKVSICDIFNMTRDATEKDVISKLPMVWNYGNKTNGVWVVALMFYMRNIRSVDCVISEECNVKVSKGRGEKLLSYYIALWLLRKDPQLFCTNYNRFVHDLGYYKDCLLLAKMAKDRGYSTDEIRTLLMPISISLMCDENIIVKEHLKPTKKVIKLSLASKWAPREGKAFAEFIPYLKQLCNITGPKSDMRWRKYIQQIAKGTPDVKTIENLLSTKQYDLINFKTVPSKAFNLYKNAFIRIPELNQKFFNFIASVRRGVSGEHANEIYPHEILGKYLHAVKLDNQLYDGDDDIEAQWKCYLDKAMQSSLSLDRADYYYIPMIDVSSSMYMKGNALAAKVSTTIGLMMMKLIR